LTRCGSIRPTSPEATGKPRRAFVDAAPAFDEITQRLIQVFVCRRVPQHARRSDLSDGLIRVVQQKTAAELSIALHPALLAAIKATPANGVSLIGDANGRPIQRATLTLIMRKAVELAGLPSRCVPHGLRKAIMRRLAESGSSAKEIAAISGHRTLKEIERYTAAADQVRLSKTAMAKLGGDKKRT
jgi:integrase